jgi:hypothetical protein
MLRKDKKGGKKDNTPMSLHITGNKKTMHNKTRTKYITKN